MSHNIFDVMEEIKSGGEWLGTARQWLQSNVKGGDTLTWNSREMVSIPFCKFEELAQYTAAAAIVEDRQKQDKLKNNKVFRNMLSPIFNYFALSEKMNDDSLELEQLVVLEKQLNNEYEMALKILDTIKKELK